MNAATMRNGEAIPAASIPLLPVEEFRRAILEGAAAGMRIAALFGRRLAPDRARLFAVMADDGARALRVLSADAGGGYPALT